MNQQPNLFEEAKKSKRLLNGVLATMLMPVTLTVGQIIGQLVIGLVVLGIMQITSITGPMNLILTFILLLSFSPSLMLCFIWVKKGEKRTIASLGLHKEQAFLKFLTGFGIGLLLFALVTLFMWLFKVITLEQGIKMGLKSIPAMLLLLPAWIIQSSTEEILARGWLMHILGAKYKPMIGLVVSSVIFGLIHLTNDGVGVIAILNIILVGFLFGFYVIHTKNLWGACGMHAAWNFAQGNVFGFSVSGIDISDYSLVRFSATGSEALTGGSFGPEASIFATVVIGAALMIMIMKVRQEAKRGLSLL